MISSKSGGGFLRSTLLSLLALAMCFPPTAVAQSDSRYYGAKFDDLVRTTGLMIDALANATLNSACLTRANFDRVTAALGPEERETAIRLREAGIRTLNETRAWNTCRSQAEQATMLAADMSGAQTWSAQRARVRRAALLAENEEVQDGMLVDRSTRVPVTSAPRLAFSVDSNSLLEGTYGARRDFDAELIISEDGLVSDCNIVSSIGNEGADRTICRRAQLLLRYRPAFTNGRMTTSTTHLRIRFN